MLQLKLIIRKLISRQKIKACLDLYHIKTLILQNIFWNFNSNEFAIRINVLKPNSIDFNYSGAADKGGIALPFLVCFWRINASDIADGKLQIILNILGTQKKGKLLSR